MGKRVTVKSSLLSVQQREEGGRTAYDRFDYQTAWGISRLLDLHRKGQNYAVAFEFHDDIVALDDADQPTRAAFYQIKTKGKGKWTFAEITRRPTLGGNKKASFAGKMYDSFVKFGAVVEKLTFVSNQPLPEVLVVHGEESFSKADAKKLKKFVSNLASETAAFKNPAHASLFFFCFSELNLTSYEETVLGKIAMFLEQELGPHIPPRPFALMLNDYCRRRSKALADVSSFDELKASKAITRSNMSNWLAQAKSQHERRPEWTAVSAELNLPFPEKTRIERAWKDYEVELMARQNAATIAFTERVRKVIDEVLEAAKSLVDVINKVLPQVTPLVRTWKPSASDDFVKAVIAYELKR
jgi:hypothetical protein